MERAFSSAAVLEDRKVNQLDIVRRETYECSIQNESWYQGTFANVPALFETFRIFLVRIDKKVGFAFSEW